VNVRRLSVVLFLSIAGLLLISVAALLTQDLGRFKSPILAVANRVLPRELRIEGALSLRLGRVIQIDARDVVIANAAWARTDEMLRLGRVAASVDAASLFGGPARITAMVIDDAILQLERSASGEASWQMGPGATVPESGPPEQVRAVPQEFPVLVDEVSGRNIQVSFDDPALSGTTVIRVETLVHHAVGARLETQAQGEINGVPLSLASDLGPRDQLRVGGPVDFRIDASIGEVSLSGAGTLDSLLQPQQPVLAFALNGPNVEYLFGILNMPEITTGPLALNVSLDVREGLLGINASGEVGEFRVGLEGTADRLDVPAMLDFRFDAAGPDVRRVARFAGIDDLPGLPFTATGRIAKQDEALTLDAIELTIGAARARLSGEFTGFPRPRSAALTAQLSGPDITDFRELLRVPTLLPAAYDLRAAVTQAPGSRIGLELSGRIGEIAEQISVSIGEGLDPVGAQMRFAVSGPDLSVLGANLGWDDLPAGVFAAEGAADYLGHALHLADTALSLGSDRLVLDGDLGVAALGPDTDLRFALSGPDLGSLLQTLGLAYELPEPFSIEGRMLGGNTEILARDLVLGVAGADLRGRIALSREPLLARIAFEFEGSRDGVEDLLPEPLRHPLFSEHVAVSAAGVWTSSALSLDAATLNLAALHLDISGTLNDLPEISGVDLDLAADIPSLAQLGITQIELPDLPFALGGHIAGSADAMTGTNISGRLGDSDFGVRIALRREARPAIDFALNSEHLDVRAFLPSPQNIAASEDAEPRASDGRVIPAFAFPIELLQALDVEADIKIDALVTHLPAPAAVEARASLRDGQLRVDPFRVRGLRGDFAGVLAVTGPADAPEVQLELELADAIFARADAPPEVFAAWPRADLSLMLSGRGADLRTLAGDLDGRVSVVVGRGVLAGASRKMGQLLLGNVGTELLRAVNPFSKNNPDTPLECAVALIDVRQGVAAGNPLVVAQTRELNIFADGQVDLATEKIDLHFNTQLRRGLGISLSDLVNPYVRVSGTLATPALILDAKSAVVRGGADVATGGITFLARKFRDRFLSDPDPCATALREFGGAAQ
jgi:uncharacterized protein involved in outer membrane biogenesis